ncbi:hypothetical protein [Halorussus pelagicus]|uniref:hypothetical protein n=1 Tax=Halorussus pelagicus TaxID=2505977 RepID=UPI000FFC13FD|nr:hypothetical protein [Halorussus pelagicus]
MTPSEKFDAWLECEWLLTRVTLVLVVGVWTVKQLVGYVVSLPLGLTEFAFYLVALCLGTLVLLLWWAGNYD